MGTKVRSDLAIEEAGIQLAIESGLSQVGVRLLYLRLSFLAYF